MKKILLCIVVLISTEVSADWFYYVMKIECNNEELKVINYSAYNEIGLRRGKEEGAIDVDKLSTWRTTSDDLRVPDKPNPHVEDCSIPSGSYRVTITNEGGGYSAPYPVVSVEEITNTSAPEVLIDSLRLRYSSEYINEIVFSKNHPKGHIIYGKAP